jgi:hypothetical protein
MLNAVPLLAQGGVGDAVVEIVAMAGFAIVPVAIGAWALWASKGRPKSSVVVAGLVLASMLLLIWVAAFISFCKMPSAGEEIAVESVESAFPVLERASWSYSANQPSQNVWIITIVGRTAVGLPINNKFRVTPYAVEEQQSSAPSGWVILKQWPMLDASTSQSTSSP